MQNEQIELSENIDDQIKNCLSENLLTAIDVDIKEIEHINWNTDSQQLLKDQQCQSENLQSQWEVINKSWKCSIFNQDEILTKTYENLCETYNKLQQLHIESKNLIKEFQNNPQLQKSILQGIKLTEIGIRQLQQLSKIIKKQKIQTKLINSTNNEEFNIETDIINETSLNQILQYMIHHVLTHIFVLFGILGQKQEKKECRLLIIYLSKLQSCLEQLPGAVSLNCDDIFCYDRTDQRWQKLNQIIKIIELGTEDKVNKSYEKLANAILLANAMISKGSEYNGETRQQLMQGFGAIYYMVAKKQANIKANAFMAQADNQNAFKAWNLGEQGMLKHLLPVLFQNITYNKKIYLPSLFKPLVKNNILCQYENETINRITNDVLEPNNIEMPQYSDLYNKNKDKIMVRILCHYNLQEVKSSGLMQNAIKLIQGNKLFESIIIHIHGGGFVSMSSRSHQTYTRKWANNLKVPIFSIDYRMAPDYPYPYGIDDCWQAYMFIINYIEKYFNIKPKKVVLVGDSAGGNLVAALTVQIIKTGARIPDGIVMAYPALHLDQKKYTPSSLVALDDPLLHHIVLKLCLQSYIPQEFKPQIDPLLSPSIASDQILKRFPPTRILLGTNDPLHDESFRLANRLIQLERDVKINEYKWMPHGFLQFDIFQGMKEAEQPVKDANAFLNELLNL